VAPQEVKRVSGIWEWVCPTQENTVFKVKGDLERNLAFSIKNNIKGYGNYIFGVHVADFGKGNRFSYGVQVELNF